MIIAATSVIFGDQHIAPLPDGAVFIENGRIVDVGKVSDLKKQYPGEIVREFHGYSILPGLIDMHVHLGIDGNPNAYKFTDYEWSICAASLLNRALKKGVTTVRDVGSRDGLASSIKKAKENNYIDAIPRILTCNNGICMTGGHGHNMHNIAEECDGETEIRKAVRRQFKRGADWIKVLTSEGRRGQEFTQQELDAAVDECHRMGKPAAAHAGFVPSVEMCINAGFDTIEHGTCLTVEGAKKMAENNQTWVPTIIAFSFVADKIKEGHTYSNPESDKYFDFAVDMYKKNFKSIYDTGVRVTCGTDQVMFGSEASPVADEAEYMVKYGLTPLQAIEAATKNGADALRLGHELGQIKKGYLADLLIVSGDPSENISCLKKVAQVVFSGKLLK